MFPEFRDKSSNLAYFSRLKRYGLFLCGLYSDSDFPAESDLAELQKEKNWFLTKDEPKRISEKGVEIERNFLFLLSVLELDDKVSVLAFYSKLDYINKKNEREAIDG